MRLQPSRCPARDHFGAGDPAVQVRRRLPGPPAGLYHFAARYYDPNIGRFTSPDPSGQEENPYLYAEGDPVIRIDPQRTLSLGGIGNSLGIGTILQEASPGGTGAAETATAAMIADVGITALCAAGAAGNPGAGSCQPEEGAGMMSVLAAPPLLQDGQSAVIFTVAFIVIVALLLVFWRFKGR